MRRAFLALTVITLTACTTAPVHSSMIPVTGQTPVEEQILLSYRTDASVNASVGASEIVYSTNLPDGWSRYRSVIQHVIEHDLVSVYGHGVHDAERVYLRYGRQAGYDIVEVVRLGRLEPARAFRQSFDGLQQIETLTYFFDPATRALAGVNGPVALEY